MLQENINDVFFGYEDDIIDPCLDNVFKAIFTKETPVDGTNERSIRYDINCKFDDNERCNIEMTVNPDNFEPARLEYYSGKLLTSQDIRGKDKTYGDLKQTYQISLLVSKPIIDDDSFLHHFVYFDEERSISLKGITHIITLELSKLDQIVSKPVSEMTATERWAVFFRYTSDKRKRDLVNEIIKMEGGIAMAGQVLLTISKDEEERLRLISQEKNILDYQSGMTNARRAGLKEGERIGEKRADIKWQNVVADKDAEIAELKRQLGEK